MATTTIGVRSVTKPAQHGAGFHALWFAAGCALAFAVPYALTTLVELQRDAYYTVYFAAAVLFVATYVGQAGIDVGAFVRRNLVLSLVLGAAMAAWLVFDIFTREDSTSHPGGVYFAFELGWRGAIYGAVDALLLTALPALVAFSMLGGRIAGARPRAEFAGVALALTLVITATYHLGYPQYREDGIAAPEFGNVMISIPALVSVNPVGSIVAHSAMHVAAVTHEYDGDRIPPKSGSD